MRWLSRNAHCNSVKLALRGVGGGKQLPAWRSTCVTHVRSVQLISN